MGKQDIHKAFTQAPIAICDQQGLVLDLEQELSYLANDVQLIATLAHNALTWELLAQFQYVDKTFKKRKSNTLGRDFRIILPDNCKKGETGRSRYEEMFRTYLFDQLKSWDARLNGKEESSTIYSSQGYRRTINTNRPEKLAPKMSLSSADSQYSKLSIENDTLILEVIINGAWRYIIFPFQKDRFHAATKITKPDITLDDHGYPIFHFTAVYDYTYTEFSTDYIIAIDVGLTNYVTASVLRTSDLTIVESSTTTLSADVHSLENKIRNANQQVRSLQKSKRYNEASYHRKANARRKRELAILAAREIAELSAQWGNAIVVFEDLSWVSNTMQNGRWNRGELVKWSEHFVSLNGGRIAKVNSAYTSQYCHACNNPVKIVNHHDVYCNDCGEWFDRDYNATGNIGKRFVEKGTHDKFVATRRKSKKVTKNQLVRVSTKQVKKHKVSHVRDKLGPTRTRPKRFNQSSRFNKNGLEVSAIKIGSSKPTELEGNIEKLVNITTITSNQSRRFIRRSMCSLNDLYSLV